MALDPEARFVLDLIAQSGRKPWYELSPAAARLQYLETRGALQGPEPDVALVRDLAATGPNGDIPVRLYRPKGSGLQDRLPVLVYFHGGGWVIGDLETHDIICRELCNRSGAALVSVDYRMGPEHKFPAAVEDAYAALHWVAVEGRNLALDTRRIAVGGDSAGGNLAAVCSLMAREQGPRLAFQLLIYPATDLVGDTASHRELADGYMLTHEAIAWFAGHYLNGPADRLDWRASPLRAQDLHGLPPALVITAGFDPLKDEGKAYAERLRAAGVAVEFTCYEGMFHGFFGMNGKIAVARQAIARSAAALAAAFGTKGSITGD